MTSAPQKTQTEIFLEWYEAEKKKGLVDIKFFKANTSSSTSEDFLREVNEMINAPESDFTEDLR